MSIEFRGFVGAIHELPLHFRIPAFAVIFLLLTAAAEAGPKSGTELATIQVLFRVEAVTREDLYMGEVWTPSIRGARAGEQFSMEAKTVGLDSQGRQHEITAEWEVSDPAVARVSGKGPRITLIILKEGQSNLTVSYGRISKTLSLRAWQTGDVIHVEIAQ